MRGADKTMGDDSRDNEFDVRLNMLVSFASEHESFLE